MSPLEILKRYWGYEAFRPLQPEIIDCVSGGRDTLALLPTGGGKSICFQVPGLLRGGVTLVISPLIALMKDQVERLQDLGLPAAYVNSSMPVAQIDAVLQGAMDGTFRFLYLAPERIESEMFRLRLPKMDVRLLVVDEAHCISQWGYDFRPAYLRIAEIRTAKPQVPVIALTASATPQVQEDIVDKLKLKEPGRFAKSFRRENLRYFVLEEENVAARCLKIAARTQGTGIIYARTRRLTEQLAKLLQQQHILAEAYHGGLSTSRRNEIQRAWLDDRLRIIVATNAFGMGIDKPDVRFVLHYNLPFDLESYYQEAGRGGRDGKTALAIAFHSPVDLKDMDRWNGQKYPPFEQVARHFRLLCDHFRISKNDAYSELFDFELGELLALSGEPALDWYHSLRILHNEGVIFFNEDKDDYAYLFMLAQPADVMRYKEQHPGAIELLDFVLRQAGGQVYTREVRFNPEQWARKIDLPPLELHYQLERLMTHGMLRYTPATDRPGIRFLSPRRALTKRELNWSKYTFLQEQADRRLAAMVDYVTRTDTCRSLLIQRYFGEASDTPCGKCDVCIGRHRKGVGDQAFLALQEAVLAFLQAQPRTYKEVVEELGAGSPAQREEVLRYLMDKGLVEVKGDGKLGVG